MVGKQREKKKYMKKIMSKMFPNLLKTINPHIQEAQSTQYKKYEESCRKTHIIIKLLNASDKRKILKATRE